MANEKELPTFKTRPACQKDYAILKHMIATEETQKLRDTDNAIVLAVEKTATKTEIKAAVQAVFGVKVKSVNTIRVTGKTKRVGRYEGKLPDYKKAIVRLDSSFDLGQIQNLVASEEMQANVETTSDDKAE